MQAVEGVGEPSQRDPSALDEARQQLAATSEILHVISISPSDAQPVFETIVRRAVTLCGSLFANVFRFDGEQLHFVASHHTGHNFEQMLRAKYPMRPDRSQVSGRVILAGSVVVMEDAQRDPEYDQRFPVAMGWRRVRPTAPRRTSSPRSRWR